MTTLYFVKNDLKGENEFSDTIQILEPNQN